MNKISRERYIDPFFNNAINQIFMQPEKSLFVMDGAVGTGKTSEFTVRGAYNIACAIPPIRKGSRNVRESKWAIIRQSEQSAYNTLSNILIRSIFGIETIAADPSIVTSRSMHPKEIWIVHDLPDKTTLEMCVECHGFNTEESYERLKTHEFLGIMIPEMQGIPWSVVTTAIERCGRWNTENIYLQKTINGKTYTLSGANKLKMVIADINIPPRPHALYENWYDKKDKKSLPFLFMRPPQPILPIPVEEVKDLKNLEKKYPKTTYEGMEVLWVPNPKAYNFTRHYEERDIENGKNIPWTGYDYWLSQTHRSDSEVTRYIVGKPDSRSGKAAIYRKFKKSDTTVCEKELQRDRPVYVGIDPGGHAGIMMLQWYADNHIHVFKEFHFTLEDNVSTREQIRDFFMPYCMKNLRGMLLVIIPDPAIMWLGKNRMSTDSESAMNILQSELQNARRNKDNTCSFKIEPPLVRNQEVLTRIDSLGYFISKGLLSIDPSCESFIDGLMGEYHYKTIKKIISDQVDKSNPCCDVVEAVQYPTVNILKHINKKRGRHGKTHKARQGTIKKR